MPKRIDSMPEYRANLPKATHNLSHKLGMTATVAHLLPIYHDFLNPGEKVELGFDFNLRTQPLQSAAMVDIVTHTEYFFVPMQLLYEPFGSMYYNLNDNYSSLYPRPTVSATSQIVSDEFPVLNFADVRQKVFDNAGDIIGFEAFGNQYVRLMDLIGMNPYYNSSVASHNFNPSVFPYQLLAYHCIYQYYYRLDTRERFDQHVFNWDRYYSTSLVSLDLSDVEKMFTLHYRPYNDDYFTSVKVSPIVDVLNLNVKNSLPVVNNWLTRNILDSDSLNEVISSGGQGLSYDVVPPPSMTNGSPNGYPFNTPNINTQTNFGFRAIEDETSDNYPVWNGVDINTANIRAIFANEKLWSITGRSKKHYDDQTLAHFGFEVPHDPKHEITCFGHDTSRIHIGEVISTGASEQAALGEIAGKGYGSQSNQRHKFTAPCHGVVMVIQSFVPDVTYCATYGKYNVMTSRNDLYQPEYDHLGMQPLFGYEAYPQLVDYRDEIFGWQYRYEQWKRRYNRVTLAFGQSFGVEDVGSLDSWMLDFHPYYSPTGMNQFTNVNSYKHFLHRPYELNQLMLVNYVDTLESQSPADLSLIYDGDPFVVDGFVYSQKVSTMSDYSLPRLDA